jgi:hypothetical protein
MSSRKLLKSLCRLSWEEWSLLLGTLEAYSVVSCFAERGAES